MSEMITRSPEEQAEVDDRDLRVQARAYVQSRFYPALPVEYGDLAVDALQAYAEFGPDAEVVLPDTLNPLPRGTEVSEDGDYIFVPAHLLISALRIEHMLPEED